jgi:transaldolase/glucose-6-phosphate isomerase
MKTASNETTLHQTHALGQSIWYDNMRRSLLTSGGLAKLIAQGVRGMTSNPTIFEKAIVSSGDYEDALRKLVADGRGTVEIYEQLAIEDIRGACDLMLPLFQESGGVDGRISLEVLPELATATDKTVSEGLRLAGEVGRPNVMIKVPATPEGIPAIRALTAQGVSVNVTLIFSLLQYEEVVEAYLAGLEDRIAAGGKLDGLASVASFFVSRVDAVCDRLLKEKAAAAPDVAARCEALAGKLAIANARMAYEIYERTIASARWTKLAAAGARTQRLLWASTGTKDPRYPDTYYVDALIGADTVDTVPPATLDAFIDHGKPAARIKDDLDGAKRDVAEFAAVGLDLSRVCHGLLDDGVTSFITSMKTLLEAIGGRRAALLETASGRQRLSLPDDLRRATDASVAKLAKDRALARVWDADAKFFTADPSHERSIKSRLGWLRAPALMRGKLAELESFAADVKAGGTTDVVLLGMGGSSLWPEVVSVVWRGQSEKAGAALHVLDNTDPAAVAAVDALIAGRKALFVVASKSGGTIEIQAFERHFWQKTLARSGGDVAAAGASFAAVTDPATRLGQLAEEKHYRRVFINPADIGGRYSALSFFGLVPAALVGANVGALVASGEEFAAASGAGVPAAESPGLVLGAAIGAAVQAGRDKLTLVISPDLASFGSWIEQLVAESSGKEGKGIVPVDLEPLGAPASYGADRFFVYIRSAAADGKQDAAVAALEKAGQPVVTIAVDRREALGREIYRWEMATAIACATLGVNPFDEPNVTEAKVATSALLAQHAAEGKLPAAADDTCDVGDVDRIRAHLATATPADYIAFCAYFLRTPARDAALTRLRIACRDRTRNATTLGYGPRFLHSTGQLHKGGPNTGVFLQLTADARDDLPVPGESYSFGTLRDAQALGDLQVLKRRGRRVLRVHLGADADAGLEALADAIAGEAQGRARKSA